MIPTRRVSVVVGNATFRLIQAHYETRPYESRRPVLFLCRLSIPFFFLPFRLFSELTEAWGVRPLFRTLASQWDGILSLIFPLLLGGTGKQCSIGSPSVRIVSFGLCERKRNKAGRSRPLCCCCNSLAHNAPDIYLCVYNHPRGVNSQLNDAPQKLFVPRACGPIN